MKEDIIIELSNHIKYVVIDVIECNCNQYFLMTQVSEDEQKISDDMEIYEYDREHNNFDLIEDKEEYDHVNVIFKERLKEQKLEMDIIHNIDFDELKKLKVIKVDEYDYQFEYGNKIIKKNIEFYSKTKPMVGDYVYVSESTLADNILSYGHIKSLNSIKHNNVMVIERDEKRIYLQRYYG